MSEAKLQERLREEASHRRRNPNEFCDEITRDMEKAANALDAAEAKIARLKEAVTDLGADVLRLHKEKCDLLCPETATQPPAVGEDVVERAKKIIGENVYSAGGTVSGQELAAQALAAASLLRTKDAG